MEKLARPFGVNPALLFPATVLTGIAALFLFSAAGGVSPLVPNLLILGTCLLLLLFLKPMFSLYLLLLLSLFQNILGYWFESLYVGTWRDLLTVGITALIAMKFTITRKGFRARTPITGLILVFCALLFIQIFNPALPEISMGIFGFRSYFVPLLGFFIGLNFIADRREIKQIGIFLTVILALTSIIGIIQSKMGFSSYENLSQYIRTDLSHQYSGYSWYRVSSIFGSVWEFGNLMAFAILLLIPFHPITRNRGTRTVLFILIATLFTGLISSAALSSIYSALIGICIFALLLKKRKAGFIAASILAISLSAVFMEKVGWERVIFYFFGQYQHNTLWATVPFHEALLVNMKENFFGMGMGIALDSVGMRFGLPTSLFKQMYPDWTMEGDYFRLMHQAGFPTMIVLMTIHIKGILTGLKLRNTLTDPFLRSVAFGISLLLVSSFVTSIFRTFTAQRPLDLFIWITLGMLFSLPRLDDKEAAPAPYRKHPHP